MDALQQDIFASATGVDGVLPLVDMVDLGGCADGFPKLSGCDLSGLVQSRGLPEGVRNLPISLAPLPWAIVTAAVFTVQPRRGKGSRRRMVIEETLLYRAFERDGEVEVWYKGASLDQDDLRVYVEVLAAIACQCHSGFMRAEITLHELLRRLNMRPSVKSYQRVRGSLDRLMFAHIRWRRPGLRMQTSVPLIVGSHTYMRGRAEVVQLTLAPEIAALFWGRYIRVQRKMLHELSSQMARWVLVFFGSGSPAGEWTTWRLEELRRLCGSGAEPRRFKYLLQDALDEVNEAGCSLQYTFVGGGAKETLLRVRRQERRQLPAAA
jgi:hypothetical protein